MCDGPEEVIVARIQLVPVQLCAECAKLGDRYQADIEAAARKPLQEKIDRICELLAANGCDCDCGHQLEDHDDDCDPCLACRIDDVVSGR
jgi:hypothetical protein